MTEQLRGATTAEITKLRTLPVVLITVTVTICAAVGLAALLAPSAPDAVAVVAGSVPYLQIGPVVLGVLGTATEYAGTQIRTTLLAVPDRMTALAGKTLACSAAGIVLGAAATAAGFVMAAVRLGFDGPLGTVVGACVYLVLVGLLAHTLAVLLRSLIPALAVALGLLVVSPLLNTITEHARWLPDQAGQALYLPGSAFAPWAGALVLLGWISLIGAVAAIAFGRRDA